jgi:hypothetical protein
MVPLWERLWVLVRKWWWLGAAVAAGLAGLGAARAAGAKKTMPPTPARPQLPDVPAVTPTPAADLTVADTYKARARAIDDDLHRRDVAGLVEEANRRYGSGT